MFKNYPPKTKRSKSNQEHMVRLVTAQLRPSMPKIARRTNCGMIKTQQDTSTDLITIRGQATLRSKRVKPSMPKMPWD